VAPAYTYTTLGTFTVSLIAIDSTTCNISDTAWLTVHTTPPSSVTAIADVVPADTGCIPFTVQFINNSNADSYTWSFGDGAPDSSVAAPSYTYYASGIYNVSLVAADTGQCGNSDTAWLTITALPPPVKSLGNDTSVCAGVKVSLDAGNPGLTYLWSTGATAQRIVASDTGLYWVKVNNGYCMASDTVQISRTKGIIYKIPNIFTPNRDLFNEKFKVETDEECTFEGTIFNRWGKKIYHWTDIKEGWDGSLDNQDAADGVYYYIFHIENPCEVLNIHGFVTLIR
jgi:gliding motility-associated-like protein